jgi:dipeptidyl aminopeptidase/acylaminoacyl peptidase
MLRVLQNCYYQPYWLPILGYLLLLGCQPSGYVDKTREISSIRLDLPPAQYESVAWLDSKEIALAYKEPEAREGTVRVAMLRLGTGALEDIILPSHPDHCFPVPSGIVLLSRLPNGNLGYIYRCSNMPSGDSGVLYMWDKSTGEIQVLHVYSDFLLGFYTVSPDMTEIIQTSPVGVGLNDELYRFDLGGEGRQIFSDFQRASSPSWSPDGQTIVFAGTESTPYDSPETNEEMVNLLFYPWTIYQMNADGQEVRELLTGISRPLLKWSPDGKRIAFAATYKDKRGIWLLDVNSGEVQLIWDTAATFDWSPDGKSMIVLTREDDNGDPLVYQTYPTILTLN